MKCSSHNRSCYVPYKTAVMLLSCTLGLLSACDNGSWRARAASRCPVPMAHSWGVCLLLVSPRHTPPAHNDVFGLIFSCISSSAEHPTIQSDELGKDVDSQSEPPAPRLVGWAEPTPHRRLGHSQQPQLHRRKRNRFRTKFEIVFMVWAAAKGKQEVRAMLACSMTHF